MSDKRLLIVAHAPSANTARLLDAVIEGAGEADAIELRAKGAFETTAEDVRRAQALILGTTENLGYMSGALKDFFDRCYYPCMDVTEGLPFAYWVRAGHDGTGTSRAISSIAGGLRWRLVHEPLICRGAFDPAFVEQCRELGAFMGVGLEAGIF